jgi:hypothetical protein
VTSQFDPTRTSDMGLVIERPEQAARAADCLCLSAILAKSRQPEGQKFQ